MTVSILEYMGTLADGILTLVSIELDSNFYEATYFYTKEKSILTISEDLEAIIGKIEAHTEYQKIVNELKEKTGNFEEVYRKLQPFDLEKELPSP